MVSPPGVGLSKNPRVKATVPEMKSASIDGVEVTVATRVIDICLTTDAVVVPVA